MNKRTAITLFLGALAVSVLAKPAAAQVRVDVSIGGFYDELVPYGEWVDCSYGDCWVPSGVESDWQPYENGEWIYTDYGWTWVSYDAWGDDPYHYGTWVDTDRYGWAWVPGTVWAPAWVTWTYSNDYVGWAPLPPDIAFGYSGYAGRPIVLAPTRYVFVPTNRFVGTNVRTVRVSPQQAPVIFRQTTPVTRFAVTGGIVRNTALPIDRIQRATRTRIERRTVRTAPRPITGWRGGTRRQVSIIAPAREVRQVIASRPQRGSRSTVAVPERAHRERIKAAPETRVVVPQEPARSRPEKSKESKYRGRRSVEAPPQAPPVEVNSQGRGRGHRETSNAPVYRGRGHAPAAPPQAAPAPVQPNPRNLEKPPKGPKPEDRGRGKAKGKDKDKG